MADAPTTIAGVLEAQAERLGDKPFLLFYDRVVSFADLNREVNRAANGLARLGVGPGTGVSIMMPNSPEWLFAYWGVIKLALTRCPSTSAFVAKACGT
ncbi:MAG: AMP-binding protein [Dehalococcoidia bacterium]